MRSGGVRRILIGVGLLVLTGFSLLAVGYIVQNGISPAPVKKGEVGNPLDIGEVMASCLPPLNCDAEYGNTTAYVRGFVYATSTIGGCEAVIVTGSSSGKDLTSSSEGGVLKFRPEACAGSDLLAAYLPGQGMTAKCSFVIRPTEALASSPTLSSRTSSILQNCTVGA